MSKRANDSAQLFSNLLENGQAMTRPFTFSAAPDDSASADSASPSGAGPESAVALEQAFWKQVSDFWSVAPTAALLVAPPNATGASDKRIAADVWRNEPRYDLMKRTYLAYSTLFQRAVDLAVVDESTKAKLRYDVRQFVDAMSPTNFLATNPEAIQLALETNGQSLAEGMRLFLEDLSKGRVSTTDETRFSVGQDLAVTPGNVVFENDLVQIIQYSPTTERVYRRPLVMIPPCINKFYILDLQPENSLVRHAVAQGHTVFMLSWRNIDTETSELTWDDYLDKGVMKAIDVALEVSEADKVNALGFCVGGTLLASAMAVQQMKGDDAVASLTLLTTMLDFTDSGEIGALVSEQSVAARESAIGQGGVMQGKELSFTFSSLRANDLIWQYVVNSYLKGKAPPAFDLLYWNADYTNLSGPMFCWYVRNTYLENNLCVPGKTTQCGEPVDLSLIDVPTFLYASREDHIVPWKTAYASSELLVGETTFVLGASGHIAGVINPPAKNKRNHWVDGDAGPDPDQWLATAQSVPGSWWPRWSSWLDRHSGSKIAARVALGSRKFRCVEAAPGRYAMQKAT